MAIVDQTVVVFVVFTPCKV